MPKRAGDLRTIYGSVSLIAVTAASLSWGLPASAQEAAAPIAPQEAPTAKPKPSDLSDGDIVVTARQRGERLMAVPVVVSAISADKIEQTNAMNLEAIGTLTPTVIVANYKFNGGGSIAMRGVSSPANQLGFEQAVSVAVDGIQSSNGQIAQLGFFDVQQVEVLKGPQALFFGKNNTAGVIAVTTAGPTNQFEARIKTGYEFVAREYTTEGYIAGPLTDTLGARLAVRYRNMEGWLHNTAAPIANPFYRPASGAPGSVGLLTGRNNDRLGEKEIIARATLKYEPSSAFTAVLRATINHGTDKNAGAGSQNIGPCSDGKPRVFGIVDPFGDCKADNRVSVGNIPSAIAATLPRKINADGSPSGKLNAATISLGLDGKLGDFSIASRTGFNRLNYVVFTGGDHTTFSQFAVYEDQTQRDISQEVRISSDFAGNLNFVTGGFYQDTKRDVFHDVILNHGNYNAVANRYESFNSEAFSPGKTVSFFGQAIFKILPEVELAGGARWTKETKTYRKYNLYGIGSFDTSAMLYPGSNEVGVLKGKFRDTNVSPEATITWRPDSDHTVFAAYRSGFKSGGFGLTNPLQRTTTIGGNDFESETARGIEAGARGLFANRRLSLSAAVFAYDFSNLQVNTYDPVLVAYSINNAGKLRQRGAELETSYRFDRDFQIHGALSYVNNKFHDYVGQCYSYTFPTGATRATAVPPPNCSFINATALTLQQDYEGRTSARSPKWSGNAGFDYARPIGSYRMELTGDALYSGSYYAADTLVDASRQKAYVTLNASLAVSPDDEWWKLSLVGRNLTNRYNILYAVDRSGGQGVAGAIGEQRGVVSRGRQVALQASVKF
ncbi:MAG: TonB-dependent receptor [Sphingomonas sp. 28-66-16]|nr:MAG: TonB-dependent receptor [Sphingomonas sp. 28-66-16]